MIDFDSFDQTIALIDETEKITYRELKKRIAKKQEDIGISNFIFILCENNIDTVVNYLACLMSDNIVAMIDGNTKTEQLEQLIDLYKPNKILSNEKVQNLSGNTSVFNKKLKLLLSTSGSTGSPKFVRLTLRNVLSNAEQIIEYLDINKDDKVLLNLPLHYSYGLSILNTHLIKGAEIILTNYPVMVDGFWDVVRAYKPTSFSGVPFTYECLDRMSFYNLKNIPFKVMTQAGGKLNEEVAFKMAKWSSDNNVRFYIMYGQTEATARISYVPDKEKLNKYKTIGKSIPKGKLYLLDSVGNVIKEPYVVGELVYEGPNVMMGYAECPEDLVLGDKLKGILKTGDLAKFDSDGYFYIVGRQTRFIKFFGSRVNLDEIETTLKSKGFNCACVGKDDALHIFIESNNSDSLLESFIDSFNINTKYVFIHTIKCIPRSPQGKVLYGKLTGEYV